MHRIGCFSLVLVLLTMACVTNYPKVTMDPPWIPEATASSEEGESIRPAADAKVPIFFSQEDVPAIDGDFDEWAGLDGPITRLAVYGGGHDPADAEAFFVLRTDGVNLYIYSRTTDDVPNVNYLPGSMAWRGDTPEVFFGTSTSKHKKYTSGDNQLRIVPRSKENPMEVDIVINQRTAYEGMLDAPEGALLSAAARYFDDGYEIEASIPLSYMEINGLKVGQKVRCEFQVNDADATERDRMVHWMSDKDSPWFDPSVWGNGVVIALPEERKEVPDVL